MGDFVTGEWGPAVVIACMCLVTFCCRAAGAVIMSRVAITPRVQRGMQALPGSIILSSIAPAALDHGWPALVALAATVIAMVLTRLELVGLVGGLGTLTLVRALGF
jgi:uncharacterized membrane protein